MKSNTMLHSLLRPLSIFQRTNKFNSPNSFSKRAISDSKDLKVSCVKEFKIVPIHFKTGDVFYKGIVGTELREYIPAESKRSGYNENKRWFAIDFKNFKGSESMLRTMNGQSFYEILQCPMKMSAHFHPGTEIYFAPTKRELTNTFYDGIIDSAAEEIGNDCYKITPPVKNSTINMFFVPKGEAKQSNGLSEFNSVAKDKNDFNFKG